MTEPMASAISLWSHVFGDQTGYVYTASNGADGWKEGKAFPYPVAAENAAEALRQLDARGRDVYFSAHLFANNKARQGINAAPITCLYAEADGPTTGTGANVPAPTAIVQSSPGHTHLYFRLSRPVDPDRGAELNRRLAYALNADKSGWDLAQVLRPPGTHNHKYPDAPLVELVHLDEETVYDPDWLERILPPAPPRAKASAGARVGAGIWQGVDVGTGTEPPVRLSSEGMRWWLGERFVRKERSDDVDRSASLYVIGDRLAQHNASSRAIVEALAERDHTLGWDRYTDRPEEYARIAGKALAAVEAGAGEAPEPHASAAELERENAQLKERIGDLEERLTAAQRRADRAERGMDAIIELIRIPEARPNAHALVELATSYIDDAGAARNLDPTFGWNYKPEELAGRLGCSEGTASKRVMELKRAGVIGHNNIPKTVPRTDRDGRPIINPTTGRPDEYWASASYVTFKPGTTAYLADRTGALTDILVNAVSTYHNPPAHQIGLDKDEDATAGGERRGGWNRNMSVEEQAAYRHERLAERIATELEALTCPECDPETPRKVAATVACSGCGRWLGDVNIGEAVVGADEPNPHLCRLPLKRTSAQQEAHTARRRRLLTQPAKMRAIRTLEDPTRKDAGWVPDPRRERIHQVLERPETIPEAWRLDAGTTCSRCGEPYVNSEPLYDGEEPICRPCHDELRVTGWVAWAASVGGEDLAAGGGG